MFVFEQKGQQNLSTSLRKRNTIQNCSRCTAFAVEGRADASSVVFNSPSVNVTVCNVPKL